VSEQPPLAAAAAAGARASRDGAGPSSYYGQAVLKRPVWTWEIPVYFFLGGLAGASAGLAYVAGLRRNRRLERSAWAAAALAAAASPALLVSDLGRPERFLNMLRLFKVTSPMSVGSWVVAAMVPSSAVASADAWLGALPRLARVARPGAALAGLPMSTYTAVLLANTAIPAWHEARGTLPFLFAGGAAASAGAVAAAATPAADAGPARRLAIGGAAAELAAAALMERRLGELARPYREGAAGRLGRAGKALTAGGAALLAARGRRSRAAAIAGGLLVAGGALCARWSVFRAGFASASDPSFTVGPQRARIERGEARGGSRKAARSQAG